MLSRRISRSRMSSTVEMQLNSPTNTRFRPYVYAKTPLGVSNDGRNPTYRQILPPSISTLFWSSFPAWSRARTTK
jgi:hypothetical protein